jgi:recombination protein RecR
MQSPLIEQLITSLRVLPGVGPKSAQRMAYHLLERQRQGAEQLAKVLDQAVKQVGHCSHCRTLTEDETCNICRSERRDDQLICIVETPSDIQVFEDSAIYSGKYFVLMGHISPIDGIGPEELGLDKLEQLLKNKPIKEMVIATNPSVEGEVTAHYLQNLAKKYDVTVTRLAQGIPMGSELGYLDTGTLTQAFLSRKEFE